MNYFATRVAVVTGAGSGIGRAISRELAAAGAQLALADRDEASLAEAASECRSQSPRVSATVADVSDRIQMLDYAEAVANEFGRVDAVFCVAGVIASGSLLATDLADSEYVVSINVLGTINTTRAFLPYLITAEGGHVVVVSSAFGLMAAPNYAAYSASKFAVRGFSDALRQELALAGRPVSVTCVYPGGVRTPIVRNGRFAPGEDSAGIIDAFERRIARTEAKDAAAAILRGVERRRPRVLVGPDARLASLLTRVVPNAYPALVPWLARRARMINKARTPSPTTAERRR